MLLDYFFSILAVTELIFCEYGGTGSMRGSTWSGCVGGSASVVASTLFVSSIVVCFRLIKKRKVQRTAGHNRGTQQTGILNDEHQMTNQRRHEGKVEHVYWEG